MSPQPHTFAVTRPANRLAPEGGAGDWREQAACRDEDPELFFPIGESDQHQEQIDDAKAVCARCPVAAACLTWALDTHQHYGIWGGTTETERGAARRRLHRKKSGPS